EFYLPNYMTGKEYLNFVLSRYRCSDTERIDDFLELFDLKFAGTNLIESYSFGMKKKIQIVAAALANTDYILGDEIFNGLDFETTLLTLELFENLSREVGIVIISHNKLIIERFSENILLMSNGNLTPFLGASENLEKEVISTEKIHEKIKYIKGYHPINRVIY
ncbi:TPA: ABC transporter ATP-binding protein, partial [Enterococcus faecalis]